MSSTYIGYLVMGESPKYRYQLSLSAHHLIILVIPDVYSACSNMTLPLHAMRLRVALRLLVARCTFKRSLLTHSYYKGPTEVWARSVIQPRAVRGPCIYLTYWMYSVASIAGANCVFAFGWDCFTTWGFKCVRFSA